MGKPVVFYHVHALGKYLECFDYLCNARKFAKEHAAKGETVEIRTTDGRIIKVNGPMKRLCVFYKFADKWLGKKVEWIVCKECQKRLRAGENLYSVLA